MKCASYELEYDNYGREFPQCRASGNGSIVLESYCLGEPKYCPYLGGDDRYRREDALTESVSSCIVKSFERNLNGASVQLRELLRSISGAVKETNYELLYRSYNEAGHRLIAKPDVSDRYMSVVRSDMEQKQAHFLEDQLRDRMASFEPSWMLPDFQIEGSFLKVSDADFSSLHTRISRSDMVIRELQVKVDACSILKYEEVAHRILAELSGEVYRYFKYFEDCFLDVQRKFESGINYTLGALERHDIKFSGNLPDWKKGFMAGGKNGSYSGNRI